eukprot:g5081.t1
MFGGAASFGGSGKPLATPAPANNNGGGGFSFGATPSKPAANQNATSGGGGFSFGATPTPSGGTATSKPANGGGGFAFGATPAKPAAAGSTKPATGGGGLSFGATPAKPSAPANTANSKPAGSGGFAFGAAPAKQNTTGNTANTKPATGGGGFAFGATPAKSTTTGTAPAASATPGGGAGFSFGGTSNNTDATKNSSSTNAVGNKSGTGLFGKSAGTGALTTLGNSTNNNQQKPQAVQSTTTGVAAAKGNNYIRTFDPREIQQLFLPNFYAQRHGHNMQEENRLMTLGSNGHLIERIRLLKEKISLAHGNAMQHMFYRAALADSSGSIINECHPQYRQWFFRMITEQPQTIPGPKTSNYPQFFRAIRPNYWREAGSIENIEGIPVLPDPIQGLEQLRDYIRIRTGSLIKVDTRLNRKSGAPGGLGNVAAGNSGSLGALSNTVPGSTNMSARINVLHLQENVKTLSGVLDSLKSDCMAYVERSNNIRKRHWKLRHRLVKIIGLVKMRQNWNGPTTNGDITFREKLNDLTNRLVQPNSFRAQLQDLEMELKITHSATSKQRAPALNNMDMARLYEFLEKQHSGLAELTNVLKKDARDIGIIINSLK